tara:strand:+ start:52 stop:429 length:378 start_codon:yes stop_codon:yes gene_type:complete
MKIISEQDLNVATLHGAVIGIQAGETYELAEEIGLLAVQMGAKILTEESTTIENKLDETVTLNGDTTFDHSQDDLIVILEKLMVDGEPKDFKADGTPKAAVVNKLAGRKVSNDERNSAWEEILNS